jgi:ribosomal protein S18 acetylase RimI-like enzyme
MSTDGSFPSRPRHCPRELGHRGVHYRSTTDRDNTAWVKPDIVVRNAGDADLDDVASIKLASWTNTYAALIPDDVLAPFLDLDFHKRFLREGCVKTKTILLVAQLAPEGTVGFAFTEFVHEPEPYLGSLHVLPAFRNLGIGHVLLRATAEQLVERGYRSMRLHVLTSNVRAHRFYERHGAEYAGVVPIKWGAQVMLEAVYRWPDLVGSLVHSPPSIGTTSSLT